MSQYAVLLITHERQNTYLKRAIQYYAQIPNEVFVLDSSSGKYTQSLPQNFKYFHLPNYPMLQKIHIGIKACDAPFINIAADDNFIFFDFMQKSVDILEHNPDIVTVVGAGYSQLESLPGKFRADASVSKETTYRKFDCPVPVFYSMYRKNDILYIFDNIQYLHLHSDQAAVFFESILAMLTCTIGGIKHISMLANITEYHNLGTATHQDFDLSFNEERILDLHKIALFFNRIFHNSSDEIFTNYLGTMRKIELASKTKWYLKYFPKRLKILLNNCVYYLADRRTPIQPINIVKNIDYIKYILLCKK